jgi:hypothetical protein
VRGRRAVTGLTVLAAGALAVCVLAPGRVAVGVAVFASQVVLAVAWVALLGLPRAPVLLALGGAATADVVLLVRGGAGAGALAGVLSLGLVVALVAGLIEGARSGATDALAGAVSALALVIVDASLLALHAAAGGRVAGALALACAGVAAALVRLSAGAPGQGRRGRGLAVGPLLGLAGGAVLGLVLGAVSATVHAGAGFEIGLAVCAPTVAVAVLADRGVGGLPAEGPGGRSATAATAVRVLLPLALAAPAAYLAGRAVVG